MSYEKNCFNHLMWVNDLDDLDEDDDVYVDEMDRKLEHFYRQGDEAIAQLDKAGEDFERSLDEFTEGLEKMFDSLEGILDVALKK